jgi:hypothetical protein
MCPRLFCVCFMSWSCTTNSYLTSSGKSYLISVWPMYYSPGLPQPSMLTSHITHTMLWSLFICLSSQMECLKTEPENQLLTSAYHLKKKKKKKRYHQAPVAHAYNPSYSGGRDQEDCSLKPVQANSSWDPILKKSITKKGWWSGSRCRPWVQAPVQQQQQQKVSKPH